VRQKTINRALALLITLAAIFTAHQVIRCYFIEDTQWIHSTPLWQIVAGVIVLAVIIMWVLWAAIFRGSPVDADTIQKLRRALGD
jgi:hypothetical protein